MIKVKINGIEFECESAMDAAELAKLMVPPPAPAPANHATPQLVHKPVELRPAASWPAVSNMNRALPLDTPAGTLQRLPRDVQSFITDLSTVAGKTLEGEELGSALKLKSKHGLGPRLSSLQKALATRNVTLDNLVRKSSTNSRERNWEVASKEEIELELKKLGQ